MSAIGASGAVRCTGASGTGPVRECTGAVPGRKSALVAVFIAALFTAIRASQQPAHHEPTPQTVDEFKAAATQVLLETGVPGAGISLVRLDGVEWEGGLGYADRDAKTPVTADTHFRVGSISKTFVAMALVQLAEDGIVDLEAPVAEIAPEINIDNPWHESDPVRVIHLLQHTAGFDDMHFNERYLPKGASDLPLERVLSINPRSRRVRWPPGTRMSYSNPGYAVAGYLIEKLTAQPYEDYIQREILAPLGMSTSSFRLSAADEQMLAGGYADAAGPAVGYPRIYLRPAGNLHTSPRELGRFVRMLLRWGELDEAFIVDPEYLGNMEQPRTTDASAAGLRNGYGSGIASLLDLPFPLLGHGGGIDGFLSSYAYSPSRDVGYVILLNTIGEQSGEAMRRLSSLAIRFLKRDVDPPTAPRMDGDPQSLGQYAGYYHDANPRNQIVWPLQNLLTGQTIAVNGEELESISLFGGRQRLIPVRDASFRLERESDASRVFTTNHEGNLVLAGSSLYAVRQPRWRVESVRVAVAASLVMIVSVVPVGFGWLLRVRRALPRGFWFLKLALLACPLPFLVAAAVFAWTPGHALGTRNFATMALCLSTLAVPTLSAVVTMLGVEARRSNASRWLVVYAHLVALAMAVLALYLGSHDLLGLRLWNS